MNDSAALNINQRYEVVYCCKCSMPFAVPASIRSGWVEQGDNFYCPSGHSQHYTESDVQKLKKELAQEKKYKEWALQAANQNRDRADTAEKSRNAYKGIANKIKTRIKSGVCPCCNRTFKQLAAHMKNKHPRFHIEQPKGE